MALWLCGEANRNNEGGETLTRKNMNYTKEIILCDTCGKEISFQKKPFHKKHENLCMNCGKDVCEEHNRVYGVTIWDIKSPFPTSGVQVVLCPECYDTMLLKTFVSNAKEKGAES